MSSIGFPRAGAVLALSLLVSCGSAVAGEYTVGLKAGALLEGAQNTLKNGAGGGVLFELRSSERWQFEVGFTYGRDDGGGDHAVRSVTVIQLDLRARRTFGSARVRPFIDAGLGVYDLQVENRDPNNAVASSTKAAGGPLGAGAAIALSRTSTLRLDVEYHWVAAEVSAGGPGGSSGNLEDYVWIGAAFTYRLPGGP